MIGADFNILHLLLVFLPPPFTIKSFCTDYNMRAFRSNSTTQTSTTSSTRARDLCDQSQYAQDSNSLSPLPLVLTTKPPPPAPSPLYSALHIDPFPYTPAPTPLPHSTPARRRSSCRPSSPARCTTESGRARSGIRLCQGCRSGSLVVSLVPVWRWREVRRVGNW